MKIKHRVVRGGAWYDLPGGARAAARYHVAPGNRYDVQGFRLVCGPESEELPTVRRVVRGGSWVGSPVFAQASVRYRGNPGGRGVNIGFRLCCAPWSKT